jgi:MoaA/NifB/PqqE/SkfB family radical SAM enzyme
MGRPPDAVTCKRIVERSAQIGFKVITFGGGDPMLYSFLPDLIEAAKYCGLFVHVDTNAIGLQCTPETAKLLVSGIDLLGLPLDGPRPEIHNQIRSASSHFELVLGRLKWLAPFRHKTKINTLVSKFNARSISEMVSLIKDLSPARWSLYQYWPLSFGKNVANKHLISAQEFSHCMDALPALIDEVRVEANPIPLRRLTYPFVAQDGTVYLHHISDPSAYEFLGPIFNDEVVAEMFRRCGPERENALSRYAPLEMKEH